MKKINLSEGIVFPEEDFYDFRVRRGNTSLKLHTYRYQTKEEPKALVFLFHGLKGHLNRGAHVAKYFADMGCIVVGFDHRGHGKSQGLVGYLESIEAHLEDSNKFVSQMIDYHEDQGHQNLPIFLAGISMGGMTSFRLSIQHPERFKGVILFSPAIKTFTNTFTLKFVKLLAYFLPEFALYKSALRMGTLKTILSAMHESLAMINQLKAPWILIQGGLDKTVNPTVIVDMQKLSTSTDKTVLYYENCGHNMWHEDKIFEAMPQVVQWVKDRL